MARVTSININVNSTNAIKNTQKLKETLVELKKAKQSLGKDGKIKLSVDFTGIDKKEINLISNALAKLNKQMSGLDSTMAKLNSKNAVFNVTTNKYTNSIVRMNNAVSGSQQTFTDLTKNIVSAYTALNFMTGYLSTSFRYFKELNSVMYDVGIAGQMTLGEIDGLGVAFSKLSKFVPASAKEMGTAVNELIRTGRSFEDSKKIIQEVAYLSTASGDSLKDTAEVVTKVMVSLGISGDRVKDTLTSMHSTAIQTASDMGYLAEAFKNVAGTVSVLAKQSGYSGKELDDYKQKLLDLSMAGIGSMANLGLSASYLK